MVNVGPLAAEIVSLVWGTRANFNGFHVLAALLHGTLVVGVSQTLRHWTEGATYIRQGGHQVGHWPTFLVGKALRCIYSSSGRTYTRKPGIITSIFLDMKQRIALARWWALAAAGTLICVRDFKSSDTVIPTSALFVITGRRWPCTFILGSSSVCFPMLNTELLFTDIISCQVFCQSTNASKACCSRSTSLQFRTRV